MVTIWWQAYRVLAGCVWFLGVLAIPLLRRRNPARATWLHQRLRPQPLERRPKLWLHAVSLGECRIAMALVRQLSTAQQATVLLTTTTASGLAFLDKQTLTIPPRLLPWDRLSLYRRFWGTHEVPATVLVETEIWPALFRFVAGARKRLVIVNGRLSSKTVRWKRQPLMRDTLRRLYAVAARNPGDRDHFTAFGVAADRIRLTGNMKFDFGLPQPPRDELATWLKGSGPLVVFASISTDEVPLLAPVVLELLDTRPDLRVLWAPRHLQDLEQHRHHLLKGEPECRSTLAGQPRLVLLDTFGELASCYGSARMALVGGSFNRRGGQNFLECLQVGTPAIVGPSVENFRHEARDAVGAGALLQVAEAVEVGPLIMSLLDQADLLRGHAVAAESFIEGHKGAIARTLDHLVDWKILEP